MRFWHASEGAGHKKSWCAKHQQEMCIVQDTVLSTDDIATDTTGQAHLMTSENNVRGSHPNLQTSHTAEAAA